MTTLVVVVAVPVILTATRRASDRTDGIREDRSALATVRAAIGQTAAAGSYVTYNENSSTAPGGSTNLCAPGQSCMAGRPSTFDATSHGIINFDPFITRIDSDDSYGQHTLYVSDTTVWLSTQGTAGPSGPGVPLPQFAGSVTGALGPSAGALALLNLASPGGALNLEEAAASDATPAGTGSVGGVAVTYYDVVIDMTAMRDTPNLSAAQRATIDEALPLLERGGYEGTTERIGIDDAGYVREVTATAEFADGSTSTRHTTFTDFGCAPRLSIPGQGPLTIEPVECPPPDTATTTTTAAAGPATSTTAGSTPTTTAPADDDVAAVRAVFLAWLNADPKDDLDAVVEDFASIRDSLRQGIAQHSPADLAKYAGRVDAVEVVDDTHANVRYSVLFAGTPQYANQPGRAVKIGGRWMVARATVCALLTNGGITCPAP